jgi:L-erythro-3,5-diaminohexanoate dehydrogenase
MSDESEGVDLNLGCPYGTHRVLDRPICLPQQAEKLNPKWPLKSNELGIDVSALNIDSASFLQMKNMSGSNPKTIAEVIKKTVLERGKQHNPVTGSGGMLVGEVAEVGEAHPLYGKVKEGEKVATLVSLSLTPLIIEEILGIHIEKDRVDIKGRAIIFETGMIARLPDDLEENVALSLFDVCGAPAQVKRAIHNENFKIVIIGAGKSGLLSAYAARENLATDENIILFDANEDTVQRLRDFGFPNSFVIDAKDPIAVETAVKENTGKEGADLVINTANVPDTEMASIMSARNGGEVIFFSMSTAFTRVALGAEGLSRDLTLTIGSGYVPGHADYALSLLDKNKVLKDWFEENFGE